MDDLCPECERHPPVADDDLCKHCLDAELDAEQDALLDIASYALDRRRDDRRQVERFA